MFGLKINYSKSEIIILNLTNQLAHSLANIIGCKIGIFPIKYLGVSLHAKKLRNRDWEFLINKVQKK
jgi:hypothetical protein